MCVRNVGFHSHGGQHQDCPGITFENNCVLLSCVACSTQNHLRTSCVAMSFANPLASVLAERRRVSGRPYSAPPSSSSATPGNGCPVTDEVARTVSASTSAATS